MKVSLEKAWGYQGDNSNLPVRDLAAALPFYEAILGFHVYVHGLIATVRSLPMAAWPDADEPREIGPFAG